MKTKLLSLVVLLTVVGVSLVVAGVAGAEHPSAGAERPGAGAHPPSTGYAAYLPLITNDCTPKVTAYISVDRPVVRVGEEMTLTGAIVNECSPLVGEPGFTAYPQPSGVLSQTTPMAVGLYAVGIGEYRVLTLTLRAVGKGQVTINAGMSFETVTNDNPPAYYWSGVSAQPIVVRVLPNP